VHLNWHFAILTWKTKRFFNFKNSGQKIGSSMKDNKAQTQHSKHNTDALPEEDEQASFRILDIPHAEPDELVRIGHGMWLQQNNYATNPCIYCPSRCCALTVDLTIVEALRIAYTLVIPLMDFIELREPSDMKPAKLSHPFRLHGGNKIFTLKQDEGYCVHVVRPGQLRSRCGIYELRPAICRLYPFTMEHQGAEIQMGVQSKCPVQWMQSEDTRLRAYADMKQFQKDYADDEKWTEVWNQETREDILLETFIEFLMYEVGPALGYNPKLFTPLPERRLGKKLFSYQTEPASNPESESDP
jgi:Fe-S-cluster containining protein